MTDSGQSPSAGPSVCPFVALAEDRDRRADAPSEGNRCYAERAPRQRDLSYQADYCYSQRFSSCTVFLGWAARNAAEPAFVSDAAQRAWREGVAHPGSEIATRPPGDIPASIPDPTLDGGLLGPIEPDESTESARSEQLDWVSASAWAEVPWDERAESEADDFDEIDDADADQFEDDDEPDEADDRASQEATQAPKVPAAVPIRKRKRQQPVIRSRGSGEWFYADPPGREPLVKRRYGVTPAILLAVLGLLVAALVVFLITAIFLGGSSSAPAPSPSLGARARPASTRAPATTSQPSVAPSAPADTNPSFYRVKAGDSLSGIAAKFDVKLQHLQCINGISNRNIIGLDQRLEIPSPGFSCPPGWRNATPEP